jgi:hypothetical protein
VLGGRVGGVDVDAVALAVGREPFEIGVRDPLERLLCAPPPGLRASKIAGVSERRST